MHTRISDLGVKTLCHPSVPKEGRRFGGTVESRLLVEVETAELSYDPSKYLMVIASPVKAIPITPNRLNGAKEAKSFIQHNGNKTTPVNPNRTIFLSFPNKIEKVSASTMENARHARLVFIVADHAGIQPVDGPTDRSHASRYDVAPVYAHTLPIIENPNPDSAPMTAIRATAGRTAERADPNAAIPAGRERTPTPTIAFTRLNTSVGMVAVPPLVGGGSVFEGALLPPRILRTVDEEEARWWMVCRWWGWWWR